MHGLRRETVEQKTGRERAGGDADGDLVSWEPSASPCGDGWDSRTAGWAGVQCCESYSGSSCAGANAGRVTLLWLYDTDVSGDVSAVAGGEEGGEGHQCSAVDPPPQFHVLTGVAAY